MTLTAERVRELFTYDPDTGVLAYRVAAGRCGRYPAGTPAGWVDTSNGYAYVQIGKTKYKLHRVIWLHYYGKWPDNDVDHRDLNKINNSIRNLRSVTDFENSRNKRVLSSSKLGVKGVRRDKRNKLRPYTAIIQVNKVRRDIGYFATLEEAAEAYRKAADELHGEFARYD
jgi:hypothetical protein